MVRRALAGAVVAVALLIPANAVASINQESILQDDDALIYSPPDKVQKTLDTLAAIGVDRVRATVVWGAIAPHPTSRHRPRFDATNPNAYPPGVWTHYDELVRLAQAHGIGVDFNVSAPAPYWAATKRAPVDYAKRDYYPSTSQFAQFVTAVGRRYSGHFMAPGSAEATPVPRVDYWSIWNEPDEGGWLTPQWQRLRNGTYVPEAAIMYRGLVDAAWRALSHTGHAGDTILIGETAAKGAPGHGVGISMRPMPFLRALYCVDTRYRPLRGNAAAELSCPRTPTAAAFTAAHPGLFRATGYAHHPYSFHFAPQVHTADTDTATLADLSRLERALDRIFASYRLHIRGGLPLYLTEYGYQSRPPDPFVEFTAQQQAAFINQAEYMAYRDPRVRAFSQFLLVDDRPKSGEKVGSVAYWSTFQTGLIDFNGRPKPAYAAYRIPLWLPVARHGSRVAVWGQVRLAPRNTIQTATLEYAPAGQPFAALRVLQTANAEGFILAHVRIPQAGSVRLTWENPTNHRLYRSRTVRVS